MRASSIYRDPFPPIGPDRQSDANPITDSAEVRALRREFPTTLGADPDWLTIQEIEAYGAFSAEELGAMRDLELWGGNPFEDD